MVTSTRSVSQIDAEIDKLQKRKRLRSETTLIYRPIKTIRTFAAVLQLYAIQVRDYLRYHKILLASGIFIILSALLAYITPGSHQIHVKYYKDFLFLCVWWLGLGVLSSIGLGTGLHTFVLYLGPHIAKVTLTATECNSLDFAEYGPDSYVCPATIATAGVTYWAIVQKVQLEALLWGVGTALGELPPYFVARAARLSGMRFEHEEQPASTTGGVFNYLRNMVPSILSNLGFFGILMFASIPNPLFDLAGITCGHFLVPFWKFFGATLIGKAFIKAHLQTIFVILAFSKEHLEWLVNKIEALVPFLSGKINPILEKERSRLHRAGGQEAVTQSKSTLALAWDTILALMLFYFLASIINSSVQDYLIQKDDDKIEMLKKERAKLTK